MLLINEKRVLLIVYNTLAKDVKQVSLFEHKESTTTI